MSRLNETKLNETENFKNRDVRRLVRVSSRDLETVWARSRSSANTIRSVTRHVLCIRRTVRSKVAITLRSFSVQKDELLLKSKYQRTSWVNSVSTKLELTNCQKCWTPKFSKSSAFLNLNDFQILSNGFRKSSDSQQVSVEIYFFSPIRFMYSTTRALSALFNKVCCSFSSNYWNRLCTTESVLQSL